MQTYANISRITYTYSLTSFNVIEQNKEDTHLKTEPGIKKTQGTTSLRTVTYWLCTLILVQVTKLIYFYCKNMKKTYLTHSKIK